MLLNQRMNKENMVNVHNGVPHDIMTFADKWMEQETIILNEVTQTQKEKSDSSPYLLSTPPPNPLIGKTKKNEIMGPQPLTDRGTPPKYTRAPPQAASQSLTPGKPHTHTPLTRTWKQPRCPSTEEWIRKMWFIYTMEYYTAEKNNDTMKFAGKWMELENVILSEVADGERIVCSRPTATEPRWDPICQVGCIEDQELRSFPWILLELAKGQVSHEYQRNTAHQIAGRLSTSPHINSGQ
ncbi:hypothetical protein STEG23_024012, partial [Scotinomys teguina]